MSDYKKRTREDVESWLEERGFIDEQILLADGLDTAFIGVAISRDGEYVAVYSIDRCIEGMVERDGMSEDEAHEFFDFNILGSHVGPKTPMFLHLMPDGLLPGNGMPDGPRDAPETES